MYTGFYHNVFEIPLTPVTRGESRHVTQEKGYHLVSMSTKFV